MSQAATLSAPRDLYEEVRAEHERRDADEQLRRALRLPQIQATPLSISFELRPIPPDAQPRPPEIDVYGMALPYYADPLGLSDRFGGCAVSLNGVSLARIGSAAARRERGVERSVFWYWRFDGVSLNSWDWAMLRTAHGLPEFSALLTVAQHGSAGKALSSFLSWIEQAIPQAVADPGMVWDPQTWACWGSVVEERYEAEQQKRAAFHLEMAEAIFPSRRKRSKK